MATDERVLAEIDCFHRFYRFRQLDQSAGDQSQFEAWLDYKNAILRRDRQRCSQCGQVRPVSQLGVRASQPRAGADRMAPDNLVSVCVFCDESAGLIRPRRHSHLT